MMRREVLLLLVVLTVAVATLAIRIWYRWVSFNRFIETVHRHNHQEMMIPWSGLRGTLRFVGSMGWLNRQAIKFQVRYWYAGPERAGFLSVFSMYRSIRKRLSSGR